MIVIGKVALTNMFSFSSFPVNVKNQGLTLVTWEQQKSSWNFQVIEEQVYFLLINIFVLTLIDVFNNKFEYGLCPCPAGSVSCLLVHPELVQHWIWQ